MGAAAQRATRLRFGLLGKGREIHKSIGAGRMGILAPLLAALAGLAPPGVAHAGGLYVGEFGTPSMGTASAGAVASASDASTALHNPAGMTRLDEHQLMLGAAPGITQITFDPAGDTPTPGSDGGNQGGFVPIVSASYVHKLSERWRLGAALLSVSGAVLDPRDNWVGRNQITEVSLFTLSLAPTVAYRVTDWLSLAAGPIVTYGSLNFELASPPIPPGPMGTEREIKIEDAYDFAFSANVSGLIELTPDLRVGIAYLSETDFNLDGDIKLGGVSPNIELDLTLPQVIRWDVFWEATDKISLMAGGDWEDWSRTSRLPVSIASIDTTGDLHFRDTWKAKAGIHYRLNDAWLLKAGFAYDTSVVKNKYRNAAFPIDRQFRYAVGALHDYTEDTTLGFGFEFVDLGKARLNNNVVKGKYDRNFAMFLNFTVNWKGLPWEDWGTF